MAFLPLFCFCCLTDEDLEDKGKRCCSLGPVPVGQMETRARPALELSPPHRLPSLLQPCRSPDLFSPFAPVFLLPPSLPCVICLRIFLHRSHMDCLAFLERLLSLPGETFFSHIHLFASLKRWSMTLPQGLCTCYPCLEECYSLRSPLASVITSISGLW